MIQKPRNQYFDFIQIFRGVAALMVVFHHTYNSFSYFHQLNIPLFSYLASVGKYGVDFFFVLSGFIITYSSYNYADNPSKVKNYIWHRWVRIYVPYLPISILLLGMYSILPHFSGSNRNISLITTITLLPPGEPALSVAWTLIQEITFYAAFIIFFISKAGWRILVIGWSIGILYFYLNPTAVGPFTHVLFNNYNFEFILGYLLVELIKWERRSNFWLSISLSVFFFLLFFINTLSMLVTFPFINNLFFALGIMTLLYIAIHHANKIVKQTNIFMILGNATYSIYLVHNPLQAFLVRLVPFSSHLLISICELSCIVILCCLAGYLYYLIFERFVMLQIKKRSS